MMSGRIVLKSWPTHLVLSIEKNQPTNRLSAWERCTFVVKKTHLSCPQYEVLAVAIHIILSFQNPRRDLDTLPVRDVPDRVASVTRPERGPGYLRPGSIVDFLLNIVCEPPTSKHMKPSCF